MVVVDLVRGSCANGLGMSALSPWHWMATEWMGKVIHFVRWLQHFYKQ